MLGYAATGRFRTTSLPVAGRAHHENIDWWQYVASMPEPRVLVLQDVDENRGAGALLGEIHANIALAFHCAGYVTDGAVRDLPAVEALGFPLFAGNVAVSHMYAHVCDYGNPVEIGGLTVMPGDLVHGDRHGVHIIPLSIASIIPAMVAQLREEERDLKKLCKSLRFSLKQLDRKLRCVPRNVFELPLTG